MICMIVGAPPPATLTYSGSGGFDNSGTSSYSFPAQPIGTAATNRKVIVGVMFEGTQTVTALTIGGVSAAQTVSSGTTSIWIADVPTGTTATIAVTLSAATAGLAVIAWSAYGLNSSTAVATASVSSTAATHTLDAAAIEGGVAVAVSVQRTPNASTVSWSGLTQNIPGISIGVGVNNIVSGASTETATSQAPRAMSVTWSVSNVMRSVYSTFR